jgi:hypothetical protein
MKKKMLPLPPSFSFSPLIMNSKNTSDNVLSSWMNVFQPKNQQKKIKITLMN